jgi:hypothetical protein
MSARTEFEPLSWEEAEQRCYATVSPLIACPANARERNAVLTMTPALRESLMERCEHLRNQITRGRECLEQTRRNLSEIRVRLEEWPAYEECCGRNPLNEFTQLLLANERIEEFLPDWLRRREEALELLSKESNFVPHVQNAVACVSPPVDYRIPQSAQAA